jgi:hypothetical protein
MLAQVNFEVQLSRLRWLIAVENCRNVLRRLDRQRKYDAAQPRVPAGNTDGGQWTSGGGDSLIQNILTVAKQLRLAGSPLSYQKCLSLCYPLLERPKTHPGSDRNETDFYKCMNACLGRNFQ